MSRRIDAAVSRPSPVTITVDGAPVRAHPGESVAAALAAAGYRRLGSSPAKGGPRGMFCLMGVCQECVVRIDGRVAASCQVAVRDGMAITLGRPA